MSTPSPSNLIDPKIEYVEQEQEDVKDPSALLQAAFPPPEISVKDFLNINIQKNRGNSSSEKTLPQQQSGNYTDATEAYIIGEQQLKLFEIVSDYCLQKPEGFPLIHYRPNEKHGYWFKTTLNARHWEDICNTMNSFLGTSYNCSTIRRAFINFKNRCLTNMATLPTTKWTQPRDFDFYRLFHYKLGFLKEEHPSAYDDHTRLDQEVSAYLQSNPIPVFDEARVRKRYPKKPRFSSDVEQGYDMKEDYVSPNAFGDNFLASILPSTSLCEIESYKSDALVSQISLLASASTPEEAVIIGVPISKEWSKICLLTEISYLTKKVCVKVNEFDDPTHEIVLPNTDSPLPAKKPAPVETFLRPSFRRSIKNRLKHDFEKIIREFNSNPRIKTLLLTDSLLQALDENAVENMLVARTEFPILPRWISLYLNLNPKIYQTTILCVLGFDWVTHMANPEFETLRNWIKTEFSDLIDYVEDKKNLKIVFVTVPELGDFKAHFQLFNLALKELVYDEISNSSQMKIDLLDWAELVSNADEEHAKTFDRRLNLLLDNFSSTSI
uniref:Uncharacterized protein n=1 Tax=Acrobeloides nanus TaxID=290746 RepID=A0A914DRT2_9BILA